MMLSFLKRCFRRLQGQWHTQYEKYPIPGQKALREKRPMGFDLKHLGLSAAGCFDLYAYEIGKGDFPCLLIGGVHGNEVGTVRLMYYLIEYLAEGSREKAVGGGETYAEQMFPHLKFFIVPCLNRDGYDKAIDNPDYPNDGKVGRVNHNGVDLNRNFPNPDWQKEAIYSFGKNYSQQMILSGGESPGSEPEVQAIMKVIEEEKIQFYWDFHSCGRDITGNNLPEAQRLARLFADTTGYRFYTLEEHEALKHTGHPKEYCEAREIIQLTTEATYRWGSDWKNQKEGILGVLGELNRMQN